MESSDSVLNRIKDFITIKELSECLEVSRPTVYNYARSYEDSRLDKLPDVVVRLFDLASNGNSSDLQELVTAIKEKSVPLGKGSAYSMSGAVSVSDRKPADDVRTICLREESRYMVIFYKTPDTEETLLNLYVRDMGNYYCIGVYRPNPDRNFIIIEDVVNTVDYYYEVEQRCVDGIHKSLLNPLRDESFELR